MTHTEYILTVKKEIYESAGYSVKAVHHKIGDTITVNEATFNRIKDGEIICRFTQEGSVSFDKYNFENEVSYTEVTIQYGIKKLGQRKNKQ